MGVFDFSEAKSFFNPIVLKIDDEKYVLDFLPPEVMKKHYEFEATVEEARQKPEEEYRDEKISRGEAIEKMLIEYLCNLFSIPVDILKKQDIRIVRAAYQYLVDEMTKYSNPERMREEIKKKIPGKNTKRHGKQG